MINSELCCCKWPICLRFERDEYKFAGNKIFNSDKSRIHMNSVRIQLNMLKYVFEYSEIMCTAAVGFTSPFQVLAQGAYNQKFYGVKFFLPLKCLS